MAAGRDRSGSMPGRRVETCRMQAGIGGQVSARRRRCGGPVGSPRSRSGPEPALRSGSVVAQRPCASRAFWLGVSTVAERVAGGGEVGRGLSVARSAAASSSEMESAGFGGGVDWRSGWGTAVGAGAGDTERIHRRRVALPSKGVALSAIGPNRPFSTHRESDRPLPRDPASLLAGATVLQRRLSPPLSIPAPPGASVTPRPRRARGRSAPGTRARTTSGCGSRRPQRPPSPSARPRREA